MTINKGAFSEDVFLRLSEWRFGAKGKRPTINDVARIAGVSKKTVSRVINNEQLVRTNTLSIVKSVIDEIGFAPDPQARGLNLNHSFLVGLVYDNPNPQYVVNMQEGILAGLVGSGFELAVHRCDRSNPNYIDQVIRFVKSQKLYGLILTPSISEDNQAVARLRELDCHYVRVACLLLDDPARMIVSNDWIGGLQAARHLIQLGHVEIGFVSGQFGFKSSEERRRGFEEGLKEANLSLDPDFIFDGAYTFESGVAATERMLSLRRRPTAVFAANDEMAAGVLQLSRLRGLELPRDLSVVGFDDFGIARLTWPRLTTIHAPTGEIGKLAASKLLHKTKAGLAPPIGESEPWLVVRESTAPLTRF